MRTLRVILSIVCVLTLSIEAAARAGGLPPTGDGDAAKSEEPAKENAAQPQAQNYLVTVEGHIDELPGSNAVLTALDFQQTSLSRSVPDALRETPGIMVQSTARGMASPYVRGFTGFRTVLLIDGVRLNNSVFREGPNQYWNTVDPFSLERMEILKGPGGVLFGSDAVGGSVNVLTNSEKDYSEGIGAQGRLFQRVSTAERSYVGRLGVAGHANQDFGFVTGLTFKDFGDIRAADLGRLPKTGFGEIDGDVKAEFFFGESSRLVFLYQNVNQSDIWRTHSTRYTVPWEGTSVGSDQQRTYDQSRDLAYVQLHSEHPLSWLESLKVNLSFQQQGEEEFRIRTDSRQTLQGVDVGTLGLWVHAGSRTPVGRLVYGFDLYDDNVESFRRDSGPNGTSPKPRIQGPVAGRADYSTFGAFVEDRFSLEKGELVAGLRYSRSWTDARQVQNPLSGDVASVEGHWGKLVGSVGTLWRLRPVLDVYGNISQGFRAPNLSDLTRLDIARSQELEVPSPKLEPERFVSYEAGVRSSNERGAFTVGYFYTDINSLIVRVPTGNLVDGLFEVTKKNSGKGFVHGVEVSATYELLPNTVVSGTLTALRGEVDSYPSADSGPVRELLSRVMPTTALLGIHWTGMAGRLRLESILRLSGRQDRLSAEDLLDTQRIPPGGTPGYAVLDLRGVWTIAPRFALSMGLENLTNSAYRIHGSGQNEPGRSLVIGLDISM